jgi:hypothetical protein
MKTNNASKNTRLATSCRQTIKYEKPRVISKMKDDAFVGKELPFVGATSVYKTYVPARRGLHL